MIETLVVIQVILLAITVALPSEENVGLSWF